jgi:hypothetical protein
MILHYNNATCVRPMNDQVRLLFHELVDLPPGERQRILAERRIAADLRAELESLLSVDSLNAGRLTACVSGVAEDALDSLANRDLPECGPYRLVRLLGRGGMGRVYLGERADGEIRQTVAIKLLSADGRPRWRDRFLKERQLLASLNHPSIVHAIDAGHTADGRPYLVMEYVEGVSIDLRAAGMDLRERLNLFLSVCEGVAHAHRRLIIHRDLKPSNILVDASGKPKLLDFGIARMLDDTADATRTVERLLTPNYASPEQLRGAGQSTATDVYSLGAVLYKMLTGSSPHEADSRSTLAARAEAEEIAPPSRIDPNLPTDLDYILRKALRPEPDERYRSVDAFAGDIRAFLGSQPIEARSGNAWYRTRKFLRRYWVPVLAAAFVMASLATGLYVANRERLVAEQRFGQLRQLSNKVFDLDIAIRDLPGSTGARQNLVSDSLQYLEGLAGAARGDLDLAGEIAQGYWRVGRIQGVPMERNLGERAQAEASLIKAAAFSARVLAGRPRDRSALNLAALIANDRMALAIEEHRYTDAVAQAHESAAWLDAFLRLGNPTEGERADAASRFGNIAVAHSNMHLYAEAMPYAQREVEIRESAPSTRVRSDVGLIAWLRAMGAGDFGGALQAIQEARRAAETGFFPSETMRNNELYGTLIREGLILGGEGELNVDRPVDAIAVFRKALALSEESVRKDSNDATSRARAARAGIALANIVRRQNPRQALALDEAALARLGEIRNSLPAQRDRAMALASSSYPLRMLTRAPEAEQRIDTALTILKDTRDYPAKRYYFDSAVYPVLCALADHQADTGEPRRAVQTYEQLLAGVVAGEPAGLTDLQTAFKFSRLYEAVAQLYRRIGDPSQAARIEAQRAELWRNWSRKLPNNSYVRRQLGSIDR